MVESSTPKLKRLGAAVAPLSFAQERLWLIDAAAPGSATYNVPILMRWNGQVDAEALGVALSAVVARHEVLRTTYRLCDGRPVQVINPAEPVPVEVIDLDGMPDAWTRASEGAVARGREPFDLSCDLPVRCVAWQGIPGGDAVLLLFHHIAVDGWSLAALFGDLATAYEAALAGRRPDLPELPVQYADYAVWDRECFGDPASLQYLSDRAAELLPVPPGLTLAGCRPKPPVPEGARRGAEHVFEVPEQTRSAVARLARTLRVTPFVVFLAAFQVVLQRWSDRDEFLVGAITANRHRGIEDMVGFFANTVPLHCRIQPDWSFSQLCARMRTEAFRSLTYQRIPFEQLTARITAMRGEGHSYLVDIGFALQDIPTPSVATYRWKSLRFLPTGTAKFDLMLILENDRYGQEGLVATIEHDLDHYSPDVGRRVGENFLSLLAAAVADPDRPVCRLPVTDQVPQIPIEQVPDLAGESDTHAYVLGPHEEELPVGVPGELYLAGSGALRRTGQRAVLGADGQVKRLGTVGDRTGSVRPAVELAEVRRLLEQQPAVRAAAVAHEGEPERVVAYVELRAAVPQPRSREELLRPMRRWLPSSVLPEEIRVVTAVPRGAEGTVDAAALAALPYQRLPAAADRPAELTEHERRAADLFATALAEVDHGRVGTDRLTPDADFFRLGGHSLLAVTMLAEAKRRHGVAVPPRDFLADPTVAGLGRLLAADPAAPTARAEPADRYPATSTQQRFWFIDRIAALRRAYLMPTVIEYDGAVDPDALRRAVETVLARHPALRSRFELDRKLRTVFYRTDGPPPAVTLTDVSAWSAERVGAHVSAACWTGFDLSRDAPARAEILAAGDRTLLVLVVHHIVADGWARQLLMDEIAEVYRAETQNRPARLGEPVHPGLLVGADPADGSVDARTAEVVAGLTGAPTDVWLPHDRPRGDMQSTVGATCSTTLGPELTARLRAVLGQSGCTTFMAAAALLAVTLARRGGQRDFLFAFPWAGRDAPGSAEAVGMFVNTLVLRVDLRGDPTWWEVLARIRDSSTQCYRNADVPFDAIAAALHPDRDLSRPPLTPVYLSFFDAPPAAVPLRPDGTARYLPLDPLHIKYELELVVTEGHDDVALDASYAVDLFDEGTVTRLLDDLVAGAADLVSDPHAHPL